MAPTAVGAGNARKPCQKPAFRYERVFETMALSCGKIDNTQAQCKFNRKSREAALVEVSGRSRIEVRSGGGCDPQVRRAAPAGQRLQHAAIDLAWRRRVGIRRGVGCLPARR